MKRELVGIYVATLGLLVSGLSVALLIWRPTRDTNELVAILLVLASLTGIGMLITGSSAALQRTESGTHQED